jgi:hypothetical protein
LEPLTAAETECYVEHRLKVAGYWGEPLFAPNAVELIATQSRGIPRNINNICYNSLSVAYGRGQKTVTPEIAQEALTHLDFESRVPQSPALSEPASVPVVAPAPRSVAGPAPMAASGSIGGSHRQLTPQLTYKPLKHFYLPRWIVSALALTSILLPGSWYLAPSLLRIAEPTQASTVLTTSHNSPKSLAPFGPADASGSTPPTYAADPQETDSGQVLTIAAKPRQTLEEISVLYLGHFDRHLFEEICSLNPELKDPDHIQGGQLIRIPLRPHAMTKAIDTSEAGTTAKKETPGRLFAKVVALLHGR